ncbi:MAG TPA: protein kinase [Longimicrobiales bacterium]|nr:protein kinase [Longimicrobiales bacterium]
MKPSELDPKRWRQIDRLLGAALETPTDEREAFLAEACAADDQLRGELEALLAAHGRAGGLMEPPLDLPAEALAAYSGAAPFGRRVGPFRLERELGRGGMGVVYLAEDTRLGRLVALKALPPYLGTRPDAKERFRAEARAVSVLDHPNIATLYETGETAEGQLYMAFAYYRGETLEARIARGPVSVAEVVEIAEGVAAGLAAAHESGIVHRDVKPSNVLLAESGGVKLLDFGVAKVVGADVTREGIRLGTVAYMSPEQATGEPVDHRTDFWSLGVVLYEMLTGNRPFRAEDPLSLRDAILHEEPQPPASLGASVPEALEAIVARLLAKDPGDRYADAGALLAALGAVPAEDAPALPVRAPARTPSRGRSLGRSLRASYTRPATRRAVAAGLLGVAVVAAGIAGAFWVGGRASAAGGSLGIERLAVLPLENLTGDPEQQYFVDGIHDALVAELGKIGAFGVISRTSVMRYRDSEMSVPEIAAELGVDAVVEGSVFRQGDSLAVTAQLIAASPERHLWADRYRRGVADVFAITGEVARSIAAEIDIAGPGIESRLGAPRSVDPRAYDAYVRGWVHWERRNREGFELARSYFRRAIELDSTFAAAYAGLAESYNGAADWLFAEPGESYRRATALLETAARMDSTLPEVYTAMAAIENLHDWDWDEALELSSRAVEVNPSDVHALRALGAALNRLGRAEEARALLDRANELDTSSPGIGTAFVSYTRREFDRALEHVRIAQQFDDGLWQAPWVACLALSGKENHRRAIEECESAAARFGRDNPLLLASLGYAYARGGRRVEAQRVVEELDGLAGEVYVAPGLIAMIYGALGENDLAFQWLDRAYEGRDTFLTKLRAPFFDQLRADPRFDVLLRKIGFA